jgi:cytochrome P450
VPRVPDPPRFIPLNYDPPESAGYRNVLMPFFSPRAVNAMEARVREISVEVIERVSAKGECDFVDEVAAEIPVGVFMELMGMDRSRLKACRTMADNFFKSRVQEDYDANGQAILTELVALMAEKRARPDEGLMSHLITAQMRGRALSDDEILRTAFLLFLGGMDTVTNTTGFTYARFAQDPALQARLAADPSMIPKFVEEGLRCFGVSTTSRLVTQDIERFGLQFREGEVVCCVLPISGRDDRKNADPMAFDIDREKQPHLTFSSGPHLCIGHLLARLEMRVLTEEWVKRVPAFHLTPGSQRHYRTGTVIALENLPLSWEAAPALAA